MGEVYKAWDKGLQRYVALKYLRFDDPELVERLFREARAQARIDHPGVCEVYEVGEEDGRPYIAMQYVEGPQLDEAARDMPLEQKVLIVKQVAEAVSAAHAAGLIHRDLKPANIKIGETEDGQLRPYVLDFGIAREQEVSGLTVTGQILGTPGYLSPEQARGDTAGLDRRTDVFSLGVILYELLGGKTPFAGDSDAEVLVNLMEAQPTPLRRLAPDVPRDLETVVMTCLEDRRDRRYQSARELADDLGRFLEGEPIEARPISIMSRVVRRARRNKVATTLVLALAFVVLGLTAALVGSWIKYTTDLRSERNEALEARRQAELKEGEANEIADFLSGVFENSDPGSGETATARELLEKSVAKLDREFGGQPIEQARLINVIAETYSKLGLLDEAAQYAIRGYNIRREELGDKDLAVAESLGTLASIRMRQYDYESAVQYYREVLDIRRNLLGDNDPLVARTKIGLATGLGYLGELEESDRLNKEGLDVLIAHYNPDHPSVLFALNNRAILLRQMGDPEAAETLYLDLLERTRRAHGRESLDAAQIQNNLAYLMKTRGDFRGAEQHYREAMAIQDRLLERIHPWAIQIRLNLASVLYSLEEFEETELLLREVVEIRKELHPEGHRQIGTSLVIGLGRFLMQQEKYAEAEAVLREGLAIYQTALGPDNSNTLIARGSLASCLFALGKTAEADWLVANSLDNLEARGELSRITRNAIPFLADQFDRVGRADLATQYRALLN